MTTDSLSNPDTSLLDDEQAIIEEDPLLILNDEEIIKGPPKPKRGKITIVKRAILIGEYEDLSKVQGEDKEVERNEENRFQKANEIIY